MGLGQQRVLNSEPNVSMAEPNESFCSDVPGRHAGHPIRFRRWKLPGLLLLAAVVLSLPLLALLNPPHSYENPELITALNFVFVTLISLLMSTAAARSYLITGSWYFLWVGGASLAFGITLPLSASLLGLGVNGALTVHNVGALAAALCQLVSAAIALGGSAGVAGRPGRPGTVLAAYGAALGAIGVLSLVAVQGLIPPFVVPGDGFTPLRQAVLGTGCGLFALAAMMYTFAYLRTRSDFLFWYCLSLGAVAASLAGFLVQPSVGSVIGWAGRGAQQMGGVYLLVAVALLVAEARTRRASLEDVLVGLFRDPIAGYRLLFDAAFNAMVSTDQEGRVQLWNPAAERMFGLRAEEAVGRSLSSLIVPPGRRDFIRQELERLGDQAQGTMVGQRSQVEAARSGGEVFPIYLSFSALKTDSGWFTSILISDISKEKQAEIALKRSEERFRFVATNIPDILFFQDLELRYVWIFNPAAPLEDSQVVGKTDADLLPAEEAERLTEIKRGVLATGTGTRVELQLSPGGIARWYEAVYEPSRDAAGRIVGVVSYSRDITERKRAEEERERLLAESLELDRLKDQFLLVAAHELKTPLTIMRANAQALLRGADEVPPERHRMVDAVVRGCDRMNAIVQDLLDISRLQSGQLELRMERVALHEYVEQVIDRMSYLTPGRTVRIVSADPATVYADPEHLEQVLANLLDNAVRYSPGGGDVEVAVAAVDGQAVVSVRDRGVGIPIDRQNGVFQRFFRAHTQTPHDYGGMGVGLHISREIIARHGGRMWFESVENEGSAFYFSLPLRG